jgi:hypothetical protein
MIFLGCRGERSWLMLDRLEVLLLLLLSGQRRSEVELARALDALLSRKLFASAWFLLIVAGSRLLFECVLIDVLEKGN